MKIIHIVPGSGGTFYCQNCMRDSTLVKALRDRGADAVMMPLYLPLFTDEQPVQDASVPIFFGGVNAWLQQKVPLFRRTPRWIDRLFDAGWILKKAAGMEGRTSPAGLGPMTLSMLEGEEGYQGKEVERLLHWLQEHEQPDLVHLSNALLIGLAGPLKKALDVKVVCSLQDEDGWLDGIHAPFNRLCWQAIQDRTCYVDRFTPVSRWYAERMGERLELDPDGMRVVPVGIDLAGREVAATPPEPPVLGYLSRMSPGLGLDKLVEAFIALKQQPGLERLQLRATGGLVGEDEAFVAGLRRQLAARGMEADAQFLPDFSRAQRLDFLRTLTVLSVPIEQGEAFGTYILEALAAGVPVVQPRAGAFPELIEATGGGILYDEDLTGTLASLLRDPGRMRELGQRGAAVVHKQYGMEAMADNMMAVYEELM